MRWFYIAATAPIIDADDDEVASGYFCYFFFQCFLAALLFPMFGHFLGFDTTSGEAFGIFAGTAVNDTSSVTATASTWDSMWNLELRHLIKPLQLSFTRTLAIIPITLFSLYLGKNNQVAIQMKKVDLVLRKLFLCLFCGLLLLLLLQQLPCLGVPSSVFAPT